MQAFNDRVTNDRKFCRLVLKQNELFQYQRQLYDEKIERLSELCEIIKILPDLPQDPGPTLATELGRVRLDEGIPGNYGQGGTNRSGGASAASSPASCAGRAARAGEDRPQVVNFIRLPGPPAGGTPAGGTPEQDRAGRRAAAHSRMQDNLFIAIADDKATPNERLLFQNQLLKNEEFYNRVSEIQRVHASLPLQQNQDIAGRLGRELELCNAQRERRPAHGAPGGRATQRGSSRGSSDAEGTSAQPSGGSSTRNARQAQAQVNIIECIANRTATPTQERLFGERFKSCEVFRQEVIEQDRMYRAFKSDMGYGKAARLRWAVIQNVDVDTMMNHFPRDAAMDVGPGNPPSRSPARALPPSHATAQISGGAGRGNASSQAGTTSGPAPARRDGSDPWAPFRSKPRRANPNVLRREAV